MRRLALALALAVPMSAAADPAPAPRGLATPTPAATARPRRVARDRFEHTVLVGATVGVGSPRGFGGGFVELRPWRFVGVSLGGGAGGSFGPAVDVTVLVAPLGGRAWALGVEGSYAHQFSYGAGLSLPDGRAMPRGSDWLSAGLTVELRPTRGMMLRLGAGRAWLMNTRDFGVLRREEIAWAESNTTPLPGVDPLDAARAALAGETLGVWFVHLDVAPSWRW